MTHLLVQKYLEERYHQTAYQTHVYLVRGPLAPRLTRLTRENLMATKDANHLTIECTFRKRVRISKPGKKAKGKAVQDQDAKKPRSAPLSSGKRKRNIALSEEEEDKAEEEDIDEDDRAPIELTDEESEEVRTPQIKYVPKPKSWVPDDNSSDEDSDYVDDDWVHSMRSTAKLLPPRKKHKSFGGSGSGGGRGLSGVEGRIITEDDREILVLSD